MDRGPSVEAAANNAHRTLRARLFDQERDLDAVRVESFAHAIDQRRTDDHRAHTTGRRRKHHCH